LKQMKRVTITLVVLLVAMFLFVGVTSSTPYDAWYDFDDDGDIDIYDIVDIAGRYGTTGMPINKTELLLELQARMDALNATVTALANRMSGCSEGVVNIKDYSQNYGLTTGIGSGAVTLDFDNPFNSANYYLFTKIVLANDFDPGSGLIPAGTLVHAQNVVKTVANFTAEVWYGEDLLKGADVDLFYIAIEMCPSTPQPKHCAGIELLTCGDYLPPPTVDHYVKITFPITFTNASNVGLSACGMVYSGATGAGRPLKIAIVDITTTYAILALEGWNGATWEHLALGDEVQVSYTAVENQA